MEICIECQQNVSVDYLNEGICFECDTIRHDTIKKLRSRIIELEMELQKQKTAALNRENPPDVFWGDNFNNDSLH